MATKAVTAPSVALEFWRTFEEVIESSVRECNAVAGEMLWVTSRSREPLPAISVASVRGGGNAVECFLDLLSGEVTCRPARARRAVLTFRAASLTPARAATLVLDGLVCSGARVRK